MSDRYDVASIQTIDGGKAMQMFNFELQRAIESCHDQNKNASAKRTVTLKMILKPDSDRSKFSVEFFADSKLPPDKTGSDTILMSQSGKAFVNNEKQLDLEEKIASGAVEKINQETGEVTR